MFSVNKTFLLKNAPCLTAYRDNVQLVKEHLRPQKNKKKDREGGREGGREGEREREREKNILFENLRTPQ